MTLIVCSLLTCNKSINSCYLIGSDRIPRKTSNNLFFSQKNYPFPLFFGHFIRPKNFESDMYSPKLKNITRRNLLPTTCQSTEYVARNVSSGYVMRKMKRKKREKAERKARSAAHSSTVRGTGKAEKMRRSRRETRRAFIGLPRIGRIPIDSSSYRYPPADTASSYISRSRFSSRLRAVLPRRISNALFHAVAI